MKIVKILLQMLEEDSSEMSKMMFSEIYNKETETLAVAAVQVSGRGF